MPSARTASPAAIASGSTFNQDVSVGTEDFLTVIAVVLGAGAAGDVSVAVVPYLAYNPTTDTGGKPTLAPVTLPLAVDTPDPGTAAVLANGNAYVIARYRVTGFDLVNIQVKNNNVAAKSIEVHFYID